MLGQRSPVTVMMFLKVIDKVFINLKDIYYYTRSKDKGMKNI